VRDRPFEDAIPFNTTFKQSNSQDIQDSIGTAIFDYCTVIPFGVLCFFPSYALLEKFQNRWKETKLWDKLEKVKTLVVEPKKGTAASFEKVMEKFYSGTVFYVTPDVQSSESCNCNN
jgi:Fanconi anemia group J protein